MASSSEDSDRDPPAPYLVNLFYCTGAFHRLQDFALPSTLPHVAIYVWPECTLGDLAMELAAANASALPYPAIGTRLVFQLVYPDLRSVSQMNNVPPRFAMKDLGSTVIGQGGPGAETSSDAGHDQHNKSLADARFVAGDHISCAILPPLADASVAPASNAWRDGGSAMRDDRAGRGSYPRRFNGPARDAERNGRRDAGGYPTGEWRRGEALPNLPPPRPRTSGRW